MIGRSDHDIIIRPIVTEKSNALMEHGTYTFEVLPDANKIEIRKAVEDLFNVTVLAVNTQNYEGRTKVLRNRRTAKAQDWKRAIVTLKAGDKIDLL